MNHQNSPFELIAKLSSVNHNTNTELRNKYHKIRSVVDTDYLPLLNKIHYNRKNQLRIRLDETLSEIELFVHHPFLAGRTNIGIFYTKDGYNELLSDLLKPRNWISDTMLRENYIPTILYHDLSHTQITATNFAENDIELTLEDIRQIHNLYRDHHVRPQDMIDRYAFSSVLPTPNINFILFPYGCRKDTVAWRQLINLCDAFFILGNRAAESKLPHSVYKSSIPIFFVSEDPTLIKEFYADWPHKSRIKIINPLQLSLFIQSFDICCDHLIHKEILTSDILELASCIQKEIDRETAILGSLHRDDTFLSIHKNETDSIPTHIKAELAKRRSHKDLLIEQEKSLKYCLDRLNEDIGNFKKQITDTMPSDMQEAFFGINCTKPLRTVDYIKKTFFHALSCKEYARAEKCISAVKQTNSTLASILNLYYAQAICVPLSAEDLSRLSQCNPINDDHLKAFVDFASYIGLDESLRNKYAHQIKKKQSPNHFYFSAVYKEQKFGIEKAWSDYVRAFRAGSNEAGNILIDYAERAGKDSNLKPNIIKELADNLYPKAAYLHYRELINQRNLLNSPEAIFYLHISASKGYLPAVSEYAQKLSSQPQKMHDSSHVKMIISLIELLRDCKYPSYPYDMNEQLGKLYLKLSKNQKALNSFEKSKSAESLYLLARMYFKGVGIAIDIKKAQQYAKEAQLKGHRRADKLLQEISNNESRTAANETKYSQSADYSQKRTVTSSTDDGCFITTATCQAEGKPDNCPELTAFRCYRDNVLLKTESGKKLVDEYYRIAPHIVNLIENDPSAKDIYRHLYDNYILPGYLLLQEGKGAEAKSLYENGVRNLAAHYHIITNNNLQAKASE